MEKLSTETEVYHCEPNLSTSSLSLSRSSTPIGFEFLNSTQLVVPKKTQAAYSHTITSMESELEEFVHFTTL